jgi:hypothetical protein
MELNFQQAVEQLSPLHYAEKVPKSLLQ